MKNKVIHYCWFGPKPLGKLEKKCIKSWEKYLPDYKIMKWSEENVDLEECAFIKEAYENKKCKRNEISCICSALSITTNNNNCQFISGWLARKSFYHGSECSIA